jgi:hypothetical protein
MRMCAIDQWLGYVWACMGAARLQSVGVWQHRWWQATWYTKLVGVEGLQVHVCLLVYNTHFVNTLSTHAGQVSLVNQTPSSPFL